MKKIFALALAIVMMMAIALPVFAAQAAEPADGESQKHVYGSFDEDLVPNDEQAINDSVIIKYGVHQEYVVTIPEDVNFGYLSEETEMGKKFVATRKVEASGVVINGKEYLAIGVKSANAWQMVDEEENSVNVDYTMSFDKSKISTATGTVEYKNETHNTKLAELPILVVEHAAGNNGWEDKAGDSVELTFTTDGTAQEGTYKDTLTFTVEVVTGDPRTAAQA